jgi:hypothetical protein
MLCRPMLCVTNVLIVVPTLLAAVFVFPNKTIAECVLVVTTTVITTMLLLRTSLGDPGIVTASSRVSRCDGLAACAVRSGPTRVM